MSSRRLWALLLAVDTVLLLAFGGSVAGWMYLKPPHPSPNLIPRKPPVHAASKAQPAPPPVAAAPSPAPAAASPAILASAKAPVKAGPPPTLSLVAQPVSRRAAAPVGIPAKPAAEPPPAGKVKARPVKFIKKAPLAKMVYLKGPFLVHNHGKKALVRDPDGVWRISISLLPGSYRYCFIVDGKKTAFKTVNVEP